MLDADDTGELRTLQERAYGRGGALTEAEARHLQELEASIRADPHENAGAARVIDVSAQGTASAAVARPPEPAAAPDSESADDTRPDTAASVRAALRSHWRLLAAVFAIAIVVGLAAGWMLFAQRAPAGIQLNAEQRGWQTDLITERDYDDGSVVAIAEEAGVILWSATTDGGETVCAILGDGDSAVPTCAPRERVQDEGLWVILRREVDGEEFEVNAQVLFAANGDPAAATSSYSMAYGGIQYADEEEERIAGVLAESGYDPNSIWIVGYDGQTPIWAATELASQQQCLVYDGSSDDPAVVCDDPEKLWNEGGELVLDVEDPRSGDVTRITYRVGLGPSYLEIARAFDDDGV